MLGFSSPVSNRENTFSLFSIFFCFQRLKVLSHNRIVLFFSFFGGLPRFGGDRDIWPDHNKIVFFFWHKLNSIEKKKYIYIYIYIEILLCNDILTQRIVNRSHSAENPQKKPGL